MELSLSGAMQTKRKNQRVMGFSKSYEPGDITRVFYPISWDENGIPSLVCGVVHGHTVNDYQGLGKIGVFIPTLAPVDADFNPLSHDIAYKFARSVAPAIHSGQYKHEEAMLNSKPWPSEEAKRTALKELENKFDAKVNMKAVKPIISGYQTLILLEPMVCKVINGKVDPNSHDTFVQRVSNDLANKLSMLLKDPKYAPEPGARYLEVEYVYQAGKDKTQAGRALPSGLTKEFRIEQADPQAYNILRQFIEGLTRDADVIAAHFAKPIPESKILQALTNYAFMNSQYIDALSPESDAVKRLIEMPELAAELNLMKCLSNAEIAEALERSINAAQPAQPVASVSTDVALEQTTAPSIDDLLSKQSTVIDADTLNMMDLMEQVS